MTKEDISESTEEIAELSLKMRIDDFKEPIKTTGSEIDKCRDIGSIYEEILAQVEEFCNSTPAAGFSISYLETAEIVYGLYRECGGILDEIEDKEPELAKRKLTKALKILKEINYYD